MKNIVKAIPKLYPLTGNGKYRADFETEEEARRFCLGIRDQFSELGICWDKLYDIVEQRNSSVYIDIDFAEKELDEIDESKSVRLCVKTH